MKNSEVIRATQQQFAFFIERDAQELRREQALPQQQELAPFGSFQWVKNSDGSYSVESIVTGLKTEKEAKEVIERLGKVGCGTQCRDSITNAFIWIENPVGSTQLFAASKTTIFLAEISKLEVDSRSNEYTVPVFVGALYLSTSFNTMRAFPLESNSYATYELAKNGLEQLRQYYIADDLNLHPANRRIERGLNDSQLKR